MAWRMERASSKDEEVGTPRLLLESGFKRWLLGLCLGYFSMAVIKHHG